MVVQGRSLSVRQTRPHAPKASASPLGPATCPGIPLRKPQSSRHDEKPWQQFTLPLYTSAFLCYMK